MSENIFTKCSKFISISQQRKGKKEIIVAIQNKDDP
jgi:hypothetical protein